MRLAQTFTALRASKACPVGENPTCSVPEIVEMRGFMAIRLRPCVIMSTPPPPTRPGITPCTDVFRPRPSQHVKGGTFKPSQVAQRAEDIRLPTSEQDVSFGRSDLLPVGCADGFPDYPRDPGGCCGL